MKKTTMIFMIFTMFLSLQAVKAQWKESDKGLDGGTIIKIFPHGDKIFAGTNSNGIFVSSDGGASWEKSNNGLPDFAFVRDICSAGDKIFILIEHRGVFSSSDEGAVWSPCNVGADSAGKTELNRLTADGENIYISAGDIIYKSADYGDTWNVISEMNYYFHTEKIAVNDGIIYAFGFGLQKSADDGQTWTEIECNIETDSSGNNKWPIEIWSMGFQGQNIYLGTFGSGVIFSTDNGETWSRAESGNEDQYVYDFLFYGEAIYAGTYTGIYKSTNQGADWQKIGTSMKNNVVYTLASANNKIFAGTYAGGIYASTDKGANWLNSNYGLKSYSSGHFCVHNDVLFIGTNNGVFSSTDKGANWYYKNNGIENLSAWCLQSENGALYFAGYVYGNSGYSGGLFKSNDNGSTWETVNNGLEGVQVTSLAFAGGRVFAGTFDDGIQISENDCESWSRLSPEFKPNNTNAGDALFHNGSLYTFSFDNLYRSADFGKTWKDVSFKYHNAYVHIMKSYGKKLYVFTGGLGLFTTTNNGATWDTVSKPQYNCTPYSVVILGQYIIAATWGGGAYISKDGGQTWETKNEGLDSDFLYSLINIGTDLFAASNSGRVFKAKLADFGLNDAVPENLEHELFIWPNPVSEILNISSENQPARIEIFSVSGIKLYESAFKNKIDLSGFTPGCYFLKSGAKFYKFTKI